jgi:hypothetical protein
MENNGGISKAKSQITANLLKYIDVLHHYMRLQVKSGILAPRHVPTKSMLDDCFTEPSPQVKLSSAVAHLNLAKPRVAYPRKGTCCSVSNPLGLATQLPCQPHSIALARTIR